MGTEYSNIENRGGGAMPRAKFQTLTEQMFYILLCLREECCGMDILDMVPAITQGRGKVCPGTRYYLLGPVAPAGGGRGDTGLSLCHSSGPRRPWCSCMSLFCL